MFSVYLDDILQDIRDVLNVNDIAQFSIIREDGFNSSEQILREKTDMEISFAGNSYKYLCQQITSNRCAEVKFRIEDLECGLVFNGIIPVVAAEYNLSSCIVKCKIKDDSFSAYIKGFMETRISLYNRKSLSCENIQTPMRSIIFGKTHNNNTDFVSIISFDALDTFTYLINYFTNNTIPVVSNYLANNKFAFTTGFNMHNYGVSQDEIYPLISIKMLFDEIRKKVRIYMGIEYDNNGNPYLRIEQEDYFFSNVPLLSISNIPIGTIQTYDIDRNFNSLKTGSIQADTEDFNFVLLNKYDGWQESIFTSCGTCTSSANTELNLVSNWIISSNLIYEALNAGNSSYERDKDIFLFFYENDTAKRDLVNSEYVYNLIITNSNVINNWLDYLGKCFTLNRYPVNGFLVNNTNYMLTITGGFGFEGQLDMLSFANIVYDDSGSIFTYSGNVIAPPNLLFPMDSSGAVNSSYFEVPQSGNYQFMAQIIRFYQSSKPTFETEIDLQLQIIIYSDNTFTSYISYYENIEYTNDAVNNPVSNVLTTPIIALNTGNCIMARLIFKDYSGFISGVGGNFDYNADLVSLTMLSDGNCNNIEYNDQNSKPFILEFQHPLCFQDWQLMRENKGGYVSIKNQQYWLKEVTYRHKKLSTFKLIGNNPLCSC